MIRFIGTFVFIGFLGLLLQATVVHSLFPRIVGPDFVLALVVYLGLRSYNCFGLFVAFFLGLISDFASGQFIGPNAAGFIVAFHVAAFVSNKVYAEQMVIVGIISALCCLAKIFAFGLMLWIVASVDVVSGAWGRIILESFLTGVISPFIIKLLAVSAQLKTAPRRKSRQDTRLSLKVG